MKYTKPTLVPQPGLTSEIHKKMVNERMSRIEERARIETERMHEVLRDKFTREEKDYREYTDKFYHAYVLPAMIARAKSFIDNAKFDDVMCLISLARCGMLTLIAARNIFYEMLDTGKSLNTLLSESDIFTFNSSDTNDLVAIVREVLVENPDAVAKYKAGKTVVFNVLVGGVMKKTRGKYGVDIVKETLEKEVKENT
jgi:Asp-tRNA(Asn)/Glu-tRNA(Gln) amidotransferase B subunit